MKEKHLVAGFGRMSPPSIGHEHLANVMADHAKKVGGSPVLFLSKSEDKKKNPLAYKTKVSIAKKAFPQIHVADHADIKNPLDTLKYAHQHGFSHLHFVAGSDRLPGYKDLLTKYNKHEETGQPLVKHLHFVSAGERDPDGEGVSGMSASKLRDHAHNNNAVEFKKGLPSHLSDKDKTTVFNGVRSGLGYKE